MTVFTNVLTLILTAEIPGTHKEERKANSRGICWGGREIGAVSEPSIRTVGMGFGTGEPEH